MNLTEKGNDVFSEVLRAKTFGGILSLSVLVLMLVAPIATTGCDIHHSGSKTQASGATHQGTGVVVEIDKEKGKVKINHEKIDGYMDAMTMWFFVKDKALLDGLAANDRIDFTITEEQSSDLITAIKKK